MTRKKAQQVKYARSHEKRLQESNFAGLVKYTSEVSTYRDHEIIYGLESFVMAIGQLFSKIW